MILDIDGWNLHWIAIKVNLPREELQKGGARCMRPTSEAPQSAQQDSLVLPQDALLPCLVTALRSPPLLWD